jgi:hypothetical protein
LQTINSGFSSILGQDFWPPFDFRLKNHSPL